jgi:hypothetical protein
VDIGQSERDHGIQEGSNELKGRLHYHGDGVSLTGIGKARPDGTENAHGKGIRREDDGQEFKLKWMKMALEFKLKMEIPEEILQEMTGVGAIISAYIKYNKLPTLMQHHLGPLELALEKSSWP